jgi:hypothetical protein
MSTVAVTITGPIQLTRGLRANLPTTALIGQAFFCTDTGEVFIWSGSAMVGPAAAQATEIAARIAADTAEATARANADTTEATARAAETTRATGAEATLTTNLAAEATRATAAETTLTTNLAAEVSNRNTAVIAEATTRATAVSAEATSRASADTTLTTNLTAENTRATGAESTLTTNLATETARAIAAEATKQPLINFVDAESPSGQGAGNTVLTLAHAPGVASSLRVFRNGVRQTVTTDYTLSGTTLTLVLVLSSTDVIAVDYRY